MDIKIIVLIILVIVLYLVLFIKREDPNKNMPIYKYKDLRENFKTGDIILFSQRQIGSLKSKAEYYLRTEFIGSEFGHAGIIVRGNNDKLYVLECTANKHCADEYCHRLNNYGKGGIRIIGMDILLEKYSGKTGATFGTKFIEKEIPNNILHEKLKKYKHITFPDKKWLLISGTVDVAISHELGKKLTEVLPNKNRTMMCTEFIHDLLHRCGVLKEYPSKTFWPHLITNGTLDQLENIKYSDLVKFKFQNN